MGFFDDHHRLVPEGILALLTKDADRAGLPLEESRAVEAFADVAKAYCALVDAPVRDDIEAPWRQVARVLSQVYAAALDLPDVASEEAPELDGAHRPNAKTLAAWVKHLPDYYWQVFQPLQSKPEEPVCGSVADDLADVYSDLKRGLELYQQGHRTAAAWHWRFHFDSHWGRRLVGAQRALFLSGHS